MSVVSAASMGQQTPDLSSGLFTTSRSKLDPTLTSLFSTSSTPVAHTLNRRKLLLEREEDSDQNQNADESLEEGESEADAAGDEHGESSDELEYESAIEAEETDVEEEVPHTRIEKGTSDRKRKRASESDDLESAYFRKLAEEEQEEAEKREAEAKSKRGKLIEEPKSSDDNETEARRASDPTHGFSPPPQHETQLNPAASKTQMELDKAARTVFLANVSVTAITSVKDRKDLLTHLSSHLSKLSATEESHRIESFRFRSTAYSSALPKKASFTRGELNQATTHSTNAYCVYTTKLAAREAARRLNGTIILGRHLRVDEVAHPMKIDHRRCVFIGNLGFVDDETEIKKALAESEHPEDKKKAQSKALKGDVEEGLWVQFAKAGTIESVRVVRDSQTRIGKGFAYVQFKDENAVERALLFNDKKFAPMLPRKLRVTRCKKPSQTALALEKNRKPEREAAKSERTAKGRRPQHKSNSTGANRINPDEQALQGRLKKMLGKAGVAEMRTAAKDQLRAPRPAENSVLKSQPMVFEGHRATSNEGNKGLKLGGVKRNKARGQVKKRSERDKKRAAAYKSSKRNK